VGYATPLIGSSFGALLMASGLALWDGFRRVRGLSRAVRVVRWAAGGLLLAAILPLWFAGDSALALSLTLMAAIAAPPARRHPSPWHNAVILPPALALTGISFFLVAGFARVGEDITSPASLATTICGGLAARVLGEALGLLVSPATPPGRLFDALYLLLTLLAGANVLTTLWQRGVMWEAAAEESRLLGVWLAWSAAWLSPRHHPRLRAGLIAVVAILLIALALGAG
jgi:hypothetical protein